MKNLLISVVLGSIALLSSCSSMFIPAAPSLPLLQDKGEVKIDMSVSTNSLRLSTSFALTQKYALMLNGNMSYKNFGNSYDLFTSGNYVKKSTNPYALVERKYGEFTQQYIELGIGRYNITNSKLIFEVFGGLGYGHSTDTWSDHNYLVNYYSGFVQANIGRKHKNLEFGGGIRLSGTYFDYNYKQTQQNTGDYQHRDLFLLNLFEPVFMLRGGDDFFKFGFQIGLSLPAYYKYDEDINSRGILNGNPKQTIMHFSVGIRFCLSGKNDEKKK